MGCNFEDSWLIKFSFIPKDEMKLAADDIKFQQKGMISLWEFIFKSLWYFNVFI
jgi:hypothetical protein